MSTTTEAAKPAGETTYPSITLYISAYGGWNYDRTGASCVKVTFYGPNADQMAADYIARKGHLVIQEELGDDGFPAYDPSQFPLVYAALNPQCEHGLSAWLCAGPGHYPPDR